MPTIRLVSREEAQQTRTPKAPSVRTALRHERREEFDGYVQELVSNPDQALVFEGIEEVEPAQTFVFSLRDAFRRAGVTASVRKMRGRDEVRAWIIDRQVEQEPEAAAS